MSTHTPKKKGKDESVGSFLKDKEYWTQVSKEAILDSYLKAATADFLKSILTKSYKTREGGRSHFNIENEHPFDLWKKHCLQYAQEHYKDEQETFDNFNKLIKSIPKESEDEVAQSLLQIDRSVTEWGISSMVRYLSNLDAFSHGVEKSSVGQGIEKVADAIDAFSQMVQSLAGYGRHQKIDRQASTVVDAVNRKPGKK